MKTLLLSTFLLVLTACKPQQPASMASAQNFASLLVQELRAIGTVEEGASGGGQAGNIFTRNFTVALPTNSFSPGRLLSVAEAAQRKWGEYDKFSTRGTGGSDTHFRMHYGNGRSHAFVDVLAYPYGAQTKILVLIRVVE
jgi:hypothetical protein